MSTPLRRVPWWGWALMAGAVFMFLDLVVALGLAAWVVMDVREPAEAEPIDCVELANAVGQTELPAGSSAATCTYAGFQDWQIEGTMTVPRSDLDSWISQLPGSPALAETGCTDAIACVQVDLTQVGDEVDAHYLDIAVLSDDDGVAEVRMSAFTV